MNVKSNKTKIGLIVLISCLAWFAVLLQLYLIILNRVASIPETIVRFFSFFTIESNILVAICFTIILIKPKSNALVFFENSKTLTAITLYILIVGLVYNTILRFLWQPIGYQKLVDEILHSVVPLMVLFYWYKFVNKSNLIYKNIVAWLLFPSLYLIYTLVRGHFFNFYPYPFLEVNQLGYKTVLINSFFMVLTFLLIGILLIALAKRFKTFS